MRQDSDRGTGTDKLGVTWGRNLLLALCIILLSAPALRAQVLYGSLRGTVSDASGAVIPGAVVTVTNQGTGDARTIVTSGQGEYLALDLQPGLYSVAIAPKDTFGGFTEKDITINVNHEVRLDVTLKTKAVNVETVVTDTMPILQTENAEVSHEITQTQIAELPVSSSQGRNYQALYTLIPGAANVIEQNSTASNPSRAMSLNVNGVEDMSNTTRIDGAVNYYGWLPYIVAYVPPADSIQNVNVATNSFNAEQGVAGGASINVTIKSGTRQFHGSVWEYNQLFNTNARGYTATVASGVVQVPKNIFNQFGFSIGGPVYLPKILTGKKKLFFFQDFERTTRRQLITGLQTVPDTNMLGGNFNEVASGVGAGTTILYDPQPGGVGPYLPVGSRPTFMSEYPATGNAIPASRLSKAAVTMLALLQPISAKIGTPTTTQLTNQLSNDFNGNGTLAYNRNTSDSKVTYNPTESTSVFGRYSVEPFAVSDPQELGAAGGGTFDGGQPGAAAGRIQNVGLGFSHVITPNLLIDADGGYTRQVTGAQSAIDIADGDFGLNQLGIPGTNGAGPNYEGQPEFVFSNGFSSIGNSNGANPFLFRDNQFTADVNVSWTKGRHATKYGGTYYHFDLNHFQPTSGGGVSSPRGGFMFQGSLTSNSTSGLTAYNALADMLLGLPNNGTGIAVAKETQLTNPNSLRWSEYAAYAQDQWSITQKLTLNYGVRYEFYPVPYRDHQGIFRLDPTLPQTANVIAGGINGQPQSTGMKVGWGLLAPRLGVAYRMSERTVLRAGGGITEDPDSMRFLRDEFPVDISPTYSGTAAATPAVDGNGNVMTLSTGIPPPVFPSFSSGFASLPVTGSTNTAPANYRRGYIESWNLFIQQDLGGKFVLNAGYVGTHQVRQLIGLGLDSAPLPSGSTPCMANSQYNPSSPFYTHPLGSNPCSFNANITLNSANCSSATSTNPVCYNTGGITMNEPLFSSNYNGLQTQLTRNAGRLSQFGLVYTWSHAFNFEDNGAGSGSGGLPITYPGYWALNRATASYDRTNNLQFWGIYHLPFGSNQMFANHGIASAILGGFQLNGQISHVSGAPFSVSPSSTAINSPGNTEYAQLVAPYQQIGGHNRTPGNNAVTGGQPWFNPASFANPVEPVYITSTTNPANTNSLLPSAIPPNVFPNTHRNEFRGPGVTYINASVFRGFHLYKESEFQVRVEAFNVTNHPQLTSNPTATVGNGSFGYITSFGGTRTLQFSGRFNF
jgi:hypothetical protein